MRILIINAYSAKNLGDAGIVVATIKVLKAIYPECNIAVMSSYWVENQAFYMSYGVSSVAPAWVLSESQGSVVRYLYGAAALIKSCLRPRGASFTDFHNADLVVSAGGGYLYSSRRGCLGIGLLNVLFHYWLGVKFGKKVIGFPQSIGPLTSRVDVYIVRLVLSRISLLMSREAVSTAILSDMGLSNHVQTPDIAFTLMPRAARTPRNVGEVRFGVTVLDWRFAHPNATQDDIEEYLHKLSAVVLHVFEMVPNARVFIIPQVDVAGEDSDLHMSQRLATLVSDCRCEVLVLDATVGPEDLVQIYSGMSAFVASRMHSAIFALAGGVPVVALAYQPKTTGTFSLLGLDDFVFPIESFDAGKFALLLVSMVQDGFSFPANCTSRAVEIRDAVRAALA